MAASLGTGMLTLSGGMNAIFGIEQTTPLLGMIGLLIVISFVFSSISGLQKGIKVLSDVNIKIFFGLAIFIFLTGPNLEMLTFGWNGIKDYIINFSPRSLSLGNELDDTWRNNWTAFYFANWMAWAPISTLFLGFLSVGYRVRSFIHFNLIFPSLFSMFWMIILSGTTMAVDLSGETNYPLNQIMAEQGVQGVIFGLLKYLPWESFVSIVFLFVTFLSFVTAADSNTTAMSNISNHGISPENPESPLPTKIIWGVLIGGISFVMVSSTGIDGVRMLSNLGGFPALWLFMFVGASLGKLVWISFFDIKYFG
jgi:glycine betaine transporter